MFENREIFSNMYLFCIWSKNNFFKIKNKNDFIFFKSQYLSVNAMLRGMSLSHNYNTVLHVSRVFISITRYHFIFGVWPFSIDFGLNCIPSYLGNSITRNTVLKETVSRDF